MGYLCPTRPEIKNRSRRRALFRGSKSPERDIDNLTSYPAPNKLYESTFKNRTGCNVQKEIFQNVLHATGSLLQLESKNNKKSIPALHIKVVNSSKYCKYLSRFYFTVILRPLKFLINRIAFGKKNEDQVPVKKVILSTSKTTEHGRTKKEENEKGKNVFLTLLKIYNFCINGCVC